MRVLIAESVIIPNDWSRTSLLGTFAMLSYVVQLMYVFLMCSTIFYEIYYILKGEIQYDYS